MRKKPRRRWAHAARALEAKRRQAAEDQTAIARGEPVRYHILAGKSFEVECEDGSRAIVGAGWLAIREEEYVALTVGRASAEAEIERQNSEIESLRAAISWLEPPFIDDKTTAAQLRLRIGFMLADVARFDARCARALTPGADQ